MGPPTRSLLPFLAVLAGCTATAHEREGSVDAALAVADSSADARPAPDAAASPGDASASPCAVPGGVGAPCTSDGDCTLHASFGTAICLPPGRGAPNGYCSAVCMVDDDCGSCGLCVANATGTGPTPSWYGICVRACDALSPCGGGTVCAPIDPARYGCFPDCRAQPGLCGPTRCDASTGACVLGCAADTDCSDGSHCVAGQCACGPSTTCLPGSACGAAGACGCADDAACGAGHSCDTSLPCCRWSPGLCG